MKRARIKLKKSSWITRLVIAIVLVYAMVTLVCLQRQLSEKQRTRKALEAEIIQTQQENAALQKSIDEMDTDAGIQAVARDMLGLVSEGEINFFDIGD